MSLRIKKLICAVLTSMLFCCAVGFAVTVSRASADTASETFYMENGAFVRYNDDTPGIRFTSYITEECYNQLKSKSQSGEVAFYTVLEKVGSTAEKVKIPHSQAITFDENGKAVFNAALIFRLEDRELTETEVKIASAIEMKADSFAEYTDTEGQTVVVTATGSGVVRSMRGIANYAVRVGVTDEEKVFLDKYLGTVTTDTAVKEVEVADKTAVELFGLTEGAVYIGARKVGDIKSGKIDLSAETLNFGAETELYVFDGQNNCTVYTCKFIEVIALAEEYVKGLNRAAVDYTFALNDENAVTSVTAGGTALTAAEYSQSGNIVTVKGSVFATAEDVSIVIVTAAQKYVGTVEVYDMAIGTLDEFKVFWSRTTFVGGSTVTGRYVLTSDIDASSYSFNGGTVIANVTFNGVLDGKGHTVKGMHSSYYGLLQNLEAQGIIRNIAFTGIRFYRTSAIFNDNIKGTLENCYFEGTGGTAAEDNALTKYMTNTAVFKNVVVYLHDRPSGTESGTGVFRSSWTMTTAPSGLYVINTSSNGNICSDAGGNDISDVHLYSSLAEFKADVTELPEGFSLEMWHMGENGLTFGKKMQYFDLTEEYVKALNRGSEDFTFTLNNEDKVKSVSVGGVDLTASQYTQNGNTITIKSSAFETAGDISVVIGTSLSVYTGTVEVYDMAIGTLEEFKVFWSRTTFVPGSTVTGRYVLTADIDASSYSFNGTTVISNTTFNGVLDGKGHTVSGAHATYFGMFYCVGAEAIIRNIAFTGIRFYRDSSVVSDKLEGRMENCYFEGSGGTAADNNALAKRLGTTAVINNVVVYLHGRPADTASQAGVFNGLTNGATGVATAPKGVYVVNDSSNGKICTSAGTTDTSDIHLYSSLEEFKAAVTALPNGFSAEMWHIGENGLTFGKKIDSIELTEKYVKGLNRANEDYTFTLNGESKVTSVTVGGTELTASGYSQSGSTVKINGSVFTAAGDISVVIHTSTAIYTGTVEVYDIAIGTLDEFKVFWSRTTFATDSTVTGHYVLTANIDASSYSFNGGTVIANVTFNGVLDGKGYTVNGIHSSYFGLIRNLGAQGIIRNIAFTGIRFYRTSAIFNDEINGTLENCYFEGTGGTGAEDTSLTKAIKTDTAVLKNVVIYLHNRPTGAENGVGVLRSIDVQLTNAPKGVYMINESSNGKVCTVPGTTDVSDIHLYSSLAEFKAEVTELPEGFSADMWRIDGNGGLIFISSPSIALAGTLHDISVEENSARAFVKNSKSDYTIVYDNEGENLKKAVKFITDNVYKATGATLKTEAYAAGRENSWTSASKLIVFNNAQLFAKAGLTMPEADLGSGGYYIKTIGNTVFIMCSGEYGYQLGAIRFLNETLGYDRLSEDCTVFEKNGETIPDMEIAEKPDYEYRMPSTFKMPNAVYGMGFNMTTFASMFMSVPNRATGESAAFYHNSFNYLPPSLYVSAHPKWYSNVNDTTKQQLCYTAQGDSAEYQAMVKTLYEYLKQIVDANPNLNNITVTHQDNQSYCTCTACKKAVSTYGAISATYIMFLNDVDDLLQADLEKEALASGTAKREVNIVFFAYHGTKESPTKLVGGKYQPTSSDVVMNEHVGVIVAPIESYYTSTFYGTKNITEGESENIKSWSCLTNKVYVWLYETYFNNYFYPYNSWDTILPNYMFCYENSAIYMFDQGQHNQASPTAFMAFKYYLDSKAGINVNCNYAELENKFFNGYFKEASVPMKKYFNSLKARLKYLESTYSAVDGGINNGKANVLANANYWTVSVLNEYAGYINEALAAISAYETTDPDTYTMLKNHILAESLFPEYAFLTLHSDKLSATELTARRTAFKTNCEALGLTQEAEATSKSLSALFESWGLN